MHAALAGAGEVVFLSGEAGIGKTRLLRDFAQQVRLAGRLVVWGRPEVMTTPGPYSLILDFLDNLVATTGGTAADEAKALSQQLTDPSSAQLGLSASVPRKVAATIRGLLAFDQPSPVVILEDLHSVDDASLEVFFHIGRTSRDDARVLFASARLDGSHAPGGLERTLDTLRHDGVLTTIDLTRLENEDAARAIEAMLGHPAESALVETIQNLAEGVPFFIEELLDQSKQGQLSEVRVRGSIREVVLSDMRTLAANAQHMLFVASLLQGAIEPRVLAHACGVSEPDLLKMKTDAIRAGLLADDESIVFRHAIVRHVVESLQGADERQSNSRRLAGTCELLFSADPARAWQIARLHDMAGDLGKAAEFALRAGTHALSVAATSDARNAFLAAEGWAGDEQAVKRAKEGLAVVELREGNDLTAASLTRDVIGVLRASADVVGAAAALGRLSTILIRAGDRAGAISALDEAQSIVRGQDAAALIARLMAQKANLLTFYMGRFQEAESFVDQAVEMAEASSETAVLAVALDGKAEICSCRGDFASAEKVGFRSIEKAVESGDVEAIGRTHNNHAVRLVLHGRPHAGVEVLAQGRVIIQQHYGSAGVSSLDITRAWAHQMMGEPHEALEFLSGVGAVWMVWKGLAAAVRAWAHLERSESVEASLVLRQAWTDTGFKEWRELIGREETVSPDVLELLAVEVNLRISLGELPEAAGAAHAYVTASQWSGHPAEATRAHALLALVYALAGQVDQAERVVVRLNEHLAERPFPLWMGHRSEIMGLIELSREHLGSAAGHFRDAAEYHATCSNRVDQGRSLRRYGETLIRLGASISLAKEALTRARDLVLAAGGFAELARIEAALRSIGVRPRAGRPQRSRAPRPLTVREEQIAGLVAEGATNLEIAKKLYLSEGTVAGYISSALRKLDLSGRAALAAWSAKAGLL